MRARTLVLLVASALVLVALAGAAGAWSVWEWRAHNAKHLLLERQIQELQRDLVAQEDRLATLEERRRRDLERELHDLRTRLATLEARGSLTAHAAPR